MSEMLKPCPLCRGKAVYECQGVDGAVHCYDCGARGPVVENQETLEYRMGDYSEESKAAMKAEAIALWNTRSHDESMVLVPRRITEDMQIAFAEKWYSKKRCIDDCEMEDCWDAMISAIPEDRG